MQMKELREFHDSKAQAFYEQIRAMSEAEANARVDAVK
jgi:hypothetical protein